MAKINLSNEQLHLIETALDFYSRMGALDLFRILEHESIDKILLDKHTTNKEFEVGDETMRGKIVEIGDGYIKTKGSWGNGDEIKTWTDIDKIQLSPNWADYHNDKKLVEIHLRNVKNIISSNKIGGHGNYGIHNKEISDSCRDAYDIYQVIRHEFWKEHTDRSSMNVASSFSLTGEKPQVKVELDTIADIRKQKLNNLKK